MQLLNFATKTEVSKDVNALKDRYQLLTKKLSEN